MATAVATTPKLVVIDADVLIGICAKEPDKHPIATAELATYAASGSKVYAPGVIVSEALFVLCKKLQKGDLNQADHDAAVRSLCVIMNVVSPPPNGDAALIAGRADSREPKLQADQRQHLYRSRRGAGPEWSGRPGHLRQGNEKPGECGRSQCQRSATDRLASPDPSDRRCRSRGRGSSVAGGCTSLDDPVMPQGKLAAPRSRG